MFINITKLNGKTKQDVINALKSIGVEFKQHDYALQAFFDEESKDRLDTYLDSIDEDDCSDEHLELFNSEEVFDKITSSIAKDYFNNEFIFNHDLMDDIVRDNVSKFFKERNK